MKKAHLAFLWIPCLCLSGGCASSGRGYFADRWRDFSQILAADAGTTTGFQAYFGMSHLLQAGWGSYAGGRTGLRDGRTGSWIEERSELGLGPLYLHEVDWEDRSESLVGHQHARYHEEGFVEFPWEFGETITDRDPGDLGIAANAGFFGVSIAFKSLEFCDFLTGLFGWDLLEDDLGAKGETLLLEELCSLDPKTRLRAARNLAHLTGKTHGYRSYSSPNVLSREQKRAIAESAAARSPSGGGP